jgi:hypothetical protein
MTRAGGHASIEELISLELGQLGTDRERELREHVQSCGICEAERTLAAQFTRDLGASLNDVQAERMRRHIDAVIVGPPARRGSRLRSPWLQRSLMAAAVVLAAIGVYQFRPEGIRTAPEQILRSGRSEDQLLLNARPTPGGWLLEWDAEEGATACNIVVRSLRGEVLLSRTIEPGPVEISEEELSKSGAAAPWFASVRCKIGDREFESTLVSLGAE